MIIILSILGILISLLYPYAKSYIETAKITKLRADFHTVYDSIYNGIIEHENKIKATFPVSNYYSYQYRNKYNNIPKYEFFITTDTGGEINLYNNSVVEYHEKMESFFHTLKDFYPDNAKLYLNGHGKTGDEDIYSSPYVSSSYFDFKLGGRNYSKIINELDYLIPAKNYYNFSDEGNEFLLHTPFNWMFENYYPNGISLTLSLDLTLNLNYPVKDNDRNTYVMGLVYDITNQNVAHIIIANEGYICIDCGELIKVIK